MGKIQLETHIRGSLLLMFSPGQVKLWELVALVGVRVHTSAYKAHRVAIQGNLWVYQKIIILNVIHNVNSLWGGVTVLTAGLN